MIRVFYNPLAKSHQGKKECDRYTAALTTEYKVYNVLDYEYLEPLLTTFDPSDEIVVVGGDGTFSQFIRRRGNHDGNIRFVRAGTVLPGLMMSYIPRNMIVRLSPHLKLHPSLIPLA